MTDHAKAIRAHLQQMDAGVYVSHLGVERALEHLTALEAELQQARKERDEAMADKRAMRALFLRVVGTSRESWDNWEDGGGHNLGAELAAVLGEKRKRKS